MIASNILSTLWACLIGRGGLVPIFTGFVLYCILRSINHPLYKVPGPFYSRFTGLWQWYHLNKGSYEKYNVELHKQFGPVVRIAPNKYSINDPEAIKTIYGHGSHFLKSKFYYAWGRGDAHLEGLFSQVNSGFHAAQRRKLSSLYSMTTLLEYEPYVDKCNELLLAKLAIFAKDGRALNMPQWMQYYAFDVIGEITVAGSFGMMESECDSEGILRDIEKWTIYCSYLGTFMPFLHKWNVLASKYLGLKVPLQKVLNFAIGHIKGRRERESESGGNDFLSKLLRLQENGHINELDLMNCIAQNIAAGSDTTAISLSSIIYYLLQKPACLNKLCEEITLLSSRGEISDPVTFREAQGMPYLQAVIKEGLRVHPAVGLSLPRVVPAGGRELAGFYFPPDTIVGANAWCLHQNTDVFGHDANEFKPERWLGPPEKVSCMNENLFSFGAGSRTCIGKNISLLELSKIIPQLFRRYELLLANAEQGWATRNAWFVKQRYECKVKIR